MISLLPKRSGTTSSAKTSKPHYNAFQTMQLLGFTKNRIEKALAATGYYGAESATEWILRHIHDPTLDESTPREYILYACPTGAFLAQLEEFWGKSHAQCGWNGAHNYIPHITLVSFFKAPDDTIPNMVQSLSYVIQRVKADLPSVLNFTAETLDNFIGLVVDDEQAEILKKVALEFVKEMSSTMLSENYEPYDMISACFPWCTGSVGKLAMWGMSQSISPETPVKDLHITLAYQFQDSQFKPLQNLAQKIDTNVPCTWEFRLYSRESRAAGFDVYKVMYDLPGRDGDELNLVKDDLLYIKPEVAINSSDGWADATSWLTGCTGAVPMHYLEHTSESNTWTLHRSFNPDGKDDGSLTRASVRAAAVAQLAAQANVSVDCTPDPLEEDRTAPLYRSQESWSIPETISNFTPCSPTSKRIFLMRHAERVDLTLKNWYPYSFDSEGHYVRRDLNMPAWIPTERKHYPEVYKFDAPLTRIGTYQSYLYGEAMHSHGIKFDHVICSPSLRCVQTAHHVLKGMKSAETTPICLEAGIFEWLGWYQNIAPQFMTVEEYKTAGYNVSTTYKPAVSYEDLFQLKESIEEYYNRHHQPMQQVIDTTEMGGTILFLGHSAALETCSAYLLGKKPLKIKEFIDVIQHLPYCSVTMLEQKEGKSWSYGELPFPPITHSQNKRFDWKVMLAK